MTNRNQRHAARLSKGQIWLNYFIDYVQRNNARAISNEAMMYEARTYACAQFPTFELGMQALREADGIVSRRFG